MPMIDLTFAERAEQLLGHRDHHVICHALAVAAERFDQDAAGFDNEYLRACNFEQQHPDVVPIVTSRGAAMMADQFRRQAADTRAALVRLRGEAD